MHSRYVFFSSPHGYFHIWEDADPCSACVVDDVLQGVVTIPDDYIEFFHGLTYYWFFVPLVFKAAATLNSDIQLGLVEHSITSLTSCDLA